MTIHGDLFSLTPFRQFELKIAVTVDLTVPATRLILSELNSEQPTTYIAKESVTTVMTKMYTQPGNFSRSTAHTEKLQTSSTTCQQSTI